MTTFFSYNALVSQRAAGYKNTAYALAELIDNSFDANADIVRVILLEKTNNGRRKVEEILVLDDGSGMSKDVLQGSLQFGNTTNNNIDEVVKTRRKGKFGYGLPNASLSQCQNIRVFSWKKSSDVNFVYLDLEELKRTESIEIPSVTKQEFPPYYKGIIGDIPNSGTLVSWGNCDRLSHVRGESIIKHSSEILGRLYRHLLVSGKNVEFSVFEYMPTQKAYRQQGVTFKLRPNDPLFLMSDTVISSSLWAESLSGKAVGKSAEIYEKYVSAVDKCLPTSAKLREHCFSFGFSWQGKVYTFEVNTSVVLPEIQMPGQSRGGGTDVGNCYGEKEKVGNISFVRADREIAAGTFGFYNRTVLEQRYWSVEIKFDADADDLLGVHNNKQGIEFTSMNKSQRNDEEFNEYTADLLQARNECWIMLTEKIASAVKEAFKLVKKQSKDWHAVNISAGGSQTSSPTVPTGTQTTGRVIRRVEGDRPKALPGPQLLELERRLIEKYPNILADDIKAAIEDLDRSLTRACILYAPSESRQLWSYTKVNDFIVVLVNTNHEFYSKVLSELRLNGWDGALTAIELLLSSLAIEEESFIASDRDKEVIEAFREAVGQKLHRYITNLPEGVAMLNLASSSDDDLDE
jgi:hypothetical protein